MIPGESKMDLSFWRVSFLKNTFSAPTTINWPNFPESGGSFSPFSMLVMYIVRFTALLFIGFILTLVGFLYLLKEEYLEVIN